MDIKYIDIKVDLSKWNDIRHIETPIKELPITRNFDNYEVVGQLDVSDLSNCIGKMDRGLLSHYIKIGKMEFSIGGIVSESHMDGDIRIIDKFELTQVSIIPSHQSMR